MDPRVTVVARAAQEKLRAHREFLGIGSHPSKVSYLAKQGPMRWEFTASGLTFKTRYSIENEHILSLSFAKGDTQVVSGSGESLALRDDLLSQYVAESIIFSGLYAFLPIVDHKIESDPLDVEVVSVKPPLGGLLHLFFQRRGHELRCIAEEYGDRTVTLIPANRHHVSGRQQVYSAWKRDMEPFIEISRFRIEFPDLQIGRAPRQTTSRFC